MEEEFDLEKMKAYGPCALCADKGKIGYLTIKHIEEKHPEVIEDD